MENFVPAEAKAAQGVIENIFTDAVAGIYLFGSAVVGGLKIRSDVDVLVALNRYTTFAERKELVSKLMGISGRIGNADAVKPLELTVVSIPAVVPWRFPPSAEFIYGEWLRNEFENGGARLAVRH